jgi:hypothetical protein
LIQHLSGDRSAGGGVAAAAPAAAAPTAASSSSHVGVGAASRHLPPDHRHEAGAPLTAAPAAAHAVVTAGGGRRLRRRLRDSPSCPGGHQCRCCVGDEDVGRLPSLGPKAMGRGHTPLAAWTDLLLRRSSSSRSSSICTCLSFGVQCCCVGERVNTLSRDLCVV